MMNSLGINSVLAGVSQYANRTQKTGINKTGFMEQLQKTGAADISKENAALREASLERSQRAEGKNVTEKFGSSAWAGDMVVPQPPNYFGFTYDSSISNKSKEEMTMDEYKQWVMNEMSGMPVSGWYRSTCVGGALTITEECFERMKTDPEYEVYVLNRVRSAYSVNGLLVGSGNVSYDVIGASPEECYGYAGPVGNSGFNILDNAKSWWEKRHERMEELMAEQEKEAMKKAWARRAEVQKNHLKSQMVAFAYEENIWTE